MGNDNDNDKLSQEEEEDIGEELGLTAELDKKDAYLLLKVPDFGDTRFVNVDTACADGIDPTGVNRKVLQSFLRLGAFKWADEPPAARELLKMIPKANAASDPSIAGSDVTILRDVSGLIFVDDERTRAQDTSPVNTAAPNLQTSNDPDHKLTKQKRRTESSKLYSRGGWRDHSDGNRISTTWGDKVEVVRGNYKMIVMGRQNDPSRAMGWEASGAHIQDYAPGTMPGASYWLEWIDDSRYHAPTFNPEDPPGTVVPDVEGQQGVWLLVNTTENVYEYARNAGNFREEKWGDVHETYVGSENPPDGAFATDDVHGTDGHDPPHRFPELNYDFPSGTATKDGRSAPPWGKDNKGMVRSNPHIIEKTWAKRIDSWTGSPACPVEDIREQTDCSGAIWSTTHAGAVNERAAVGAMASSTVTSHISDTLACGSRLSTTVMMGLDIDLKYVTDEIEAKFVLVNAFSFQLASTTLGINITTGLDVEFATHKDVATVDLVFGGHLDVSTFTNKMEISIGSSATIAIGINAELKIGVFEDQTIPEKKELSAKDVKTTLEDQITALKSSITAATIEGKALKIDWG